MPRDTIEKIEKDFDNREFPLYMAPSTEFKIRILIQIAKELRVLAQRSE